MHHNYLLREPKGWILTGKVNVFTISVYWRAREELFFGKAYVIFPSGQLEGQVATSLTKSTRTEPAQAFSTSLVPTIPSRDDVPTRPVGSQASSTSADWAVEPSTSSSPWLVRIHMMMLTKRTSVPFSGDKNAPSLKSRSSFCLRSYFSI